VYINLITLRPKFETASGFNVFLGIFQKQNIILQLLLYSNSAFYEKDRAFESHPLSETL
jgi:hypothetical protein